MKAIEEQAVAKKNTAYVYKFKNGSFPAGVTEKSLNDDINAKEKAIADYQKDLAAGKKGEFTGVAFVSLKTEQQKQELIRRHKVKTFLRLRLAFCGGSPAGLKLRNQRLYISQAAEPGDVYWENLHLSDRNHYTRKFFGLLLTLFLLIICAIAILYLTYINSSTTTATTAKTSSSTTSASSSNATSNASRLLSVYTTHHYKNVHHYADSTSNDTTSAADTTSTSDTTSAADTTSTANTTSAADTATTDTSSTDSTSSSSSSTILSYVLAIAIVVINKGLCFIIPYVAS